MDNPFKKILQDEKLPEYLKGRVIDNINLIQLSLDVSELFTVKLPKTISTLLNDEINDINKKTK